VRPIVWPFDVEFPALAIDEANRLGYDRVMALQVNGNPQPVAEKMESYSAESWVRAGYLEKFHILPCVFDRAEAPAGEWKPEGGKTILAYCLEGRTSPYDGGSKQRMVRWLEENFSGEFSLLDVGGSKWPADSLAVVLREAAVLLTVDTFALHMGYAAGTPTIAITPRGWIGSEPRRNWIAQVSYDQSVTALGRATISAAIESFKAGTAEPGKLIRSAGMMPAKPFSHARKLSILVAGDAADRKRVNQLLDWLIVQVSGFFLVETCCEIDYGETTLWEKRNKLLGLANGEYCCFVDVGDTVGESYVEVLTRALEGGPDCVGFKVARMDGEKVEGIEIHSMDSADEETGERPEGTVRGITHLCPVRTEVARKIGFGAGGEEEYARKLAASGLLETEEFLDVVIYAKAAGK
jgi:hypothetical protein